MYTFVDSEQMIYSELRYMFDRENIEASYFDQIKNWLEYDRKISQQ